MGRLRLACGVVLVLVLGGPGYDRSEFPHWIDQDHDGQDTREEVLEEENLCTGRDPCWLDPYSLLMVQDPSLLDLDHVVSLKEAWDSGASEWTRTQRRAYANYLEEPDHLVLTHRSLNRSKGSSRVWLPPARDQWCWYARTRLAIKSHWNLRLYEDEILRLATALRTCP
jgi:hypothetical protein